MYSIDAKPEEQKEKVVVEVTPIKKGRRVLVFLADFFLAFLATFVFLNVMVMPIAQAITGFDAKKNAHNNSLKMMYKILYENKVVLPYAGNDDNDLNSNVEYTFNCWLSYYSLDEETSPDTKYPQYGHKVDNKVIYHYFIDIRNNNESYVSLFEHYNDTNKYFVYDTNDYKLNDLVKEKVAPYLDPKVESGSETKTLVKNIKSNVFLPMFAEVFTDIKQNDLTYEENSYNHCQAVINEFDQFTKVLLSFTVLIAHFLAVTVLYLVIPLINKNRKTIAMMMMRIERVNISRLYICKRVEMIGTYVYALVTNALYTIILPISFVSLAFIFSINTIVILSLLSLVLVLTSLIFMLFNPYNRTLSDVVSKSVLISTDKLDEIYRARGYNV